MNFITYIAVIFLIIGAFDRIIGNKFGLGREFEKGILFMGTLSLSMTGMLVIAPFISQLLGGVTNTLPSFLDPSIIPAMLLANDMGGAPLCQSLARDSILGGFNGLVVSSMMGTTISFTIPVALGLVAKKHHSNILFGLLCGIITIPLGCLVGGIVQGVPILALLINLLPLCVFSGIIVLGLLKAPNICVKIFNVLGYVINIIITIGLFIGIFEFLTGIRLISPVDTIENATKVILNASCVMAGMFPFIHILSKLLSKPLKFLGKKLGISELSSSGIFSTVASNVLTFEKMNDMDKKGIVLNSAFAVSAGFLFAGHLAFTLAFDADFLISVIIGKLVAGISALIVANFMYCVRERGNKNDL